MPHRHLFAFILLIGTGVHAQPTYRFDHLGIDRGLSQSVVTAITQDRQGFLWIGTEDGLNRFDGRTFTVYRHVLEDPSTLPSSRVTSLHVDRRGRLWVGTMGGLALFDRTTETFRVPPGAPGHPDSPCAADVTAIAPDPSGSLWTGLFSGGLCLLAPNRLSARRILVRTPDNTEQARIYALRSDTDGGVWAQVGVDAVNPYPACRTDAASGRCEFRDDFEQRIPGTPDLFASGFHPRNLLYRGKNRSQAISVPVEAKTFRAQNLLALPDGRIWLATEERGILAIDVGTGQMDRVQPDVDDPRSLASASIRALYQDRQGTVWIGTTRGLNRWQPPDPARFQVYRHGPPEAGGLSDERVSGVVEARDGAVWVATRDGLNRIDPETEHVSVLRRPETGLYTNAYWYLHEEEDGSLWVGTKRSGLLRLGPDRDRLESVPAFEAAAVPDLEIHQTQVRHIMRDRSGRMWVATGNGFAVRTADGTWHPFLSLREGNPLPTGRVNLFYQDRTGTLWAGTDGGLCRLADGARVPDDLRFHCYYHDRSDRTSLGADVVWTLAEDGLGRLWAGTVGGGLARYDPEADAFVRLTTRDGLPNNTVYGLVADASGVLWATTNAGLARVDPTTRAVTVYTTADGLPGNEFDFMAYDVGPSGRIYVGGPQGLAAFDPAEMMASPNAAPVVLTSVHVFDERVPGLLASGDTLRLRHDQNYFRLSFAALDFRTPERARYRYRLAGYESDWRLATAAASEASYTRVPPGRYVFEVTAQDASGSPTDPMRLIVVITPAWWQTTGFRGGLATLALVVTLMGVGLVFRRRQREAARADAEAAELKRRVAEGRDRERLRLARELHDGPVQDLYRLGHDLDRLRLRSETDNSTTLVGAREQVTTVATNLREILATLRPPIIPHLGLPAALEALARRVRRRHSGLDVRLAVDEEAAGWLRPEVQNTVYRVAQEALTNVSKHACARTVTIELAATGGGVELTAHDDGRGFERPSQLLDLARAEHFGLVGAAERLEVIGGRLTVETAPGQGTTVRAWVPLSTPEADGLG